MLGEIVICLIDDKIIGNVMWYSVLQFFYIKRAKTNFISFFIILFIFSDAIIAYKYNDWKKGRNGERST